MPEPLPVDAVLARIQGALARARAVVVVAPPGSGKSTRVPPALVRGGPRGGSVLLLEPRRIAAIALARRIAQEQGWRLGGEVGYRVRFEQVGGAQTRLWVMTEGVLTRQLLDAPELPGVGTVVLDEFHERSLHTDLALAYLRLLAATVREDLRLVVMSATIAPAPIAAFLAPACGGCEIIEAQGTVHPVAVRYAAPSAQDPIPRQVAQAVTVALADPDCGDVLAFLPGVGEIRACAEQLAHLPQPVVELHGQLEASVQAAALEPGQGQRVVLATNVAETAVTVPGVRTVVDSGWARIARVDPDAGVDELALERISRSAADQRAGRAGRTAPGRCIRLWSPLEQAQLALSTPPEIARLDLAPTVLALAALGEDAGPFDWFEAPPAERLARARELLQLLGATTADGRLSDRGRLLAELPAHPRAGTLLAAGAERNALALGATLAALTQERDVLLRPPREAAAADPGPADAIARLDALAQAERLRHAPHLRAAGIDPAATLAVARARDQLLAVWTRRHPGWRVPGTQEPPLALVPELLAQAFPDRIARRAGDDPNRAQMVGGVALVIDRASALYADRMARLPLLVAVDLTRLVRQGRPQVVLRQGAEIDEELLARLPGGVARTEALAWQADPGRVVALVQWRYRDLVVREAVGTISDAQAAAQLLAQALAPEARALVLADEEARTLWQRWRYLAAVRPQAVPPLPSEAQFAALLADCCGGRTTRAEVAQVPKRPWLETLLPPEAQARLEAWAPAAVTVPSGRRIALAYDQADAAQPPVLAVRLQELFGLAATPTVADGIPVLLHLLGPNYRVEQITRDLGSFWTNTYPQVRKDLRGRYPKHAWPEDPLTAPPQAKGPSRPR